MELGGGRAWPAWNKSRGYRQLAAYVASPDALDGLRLGVEMEEVAGRSAAELGVDRAARLFGLLHDKRLDYVFEKRFIARVTQQVRDPWGLIDDGQGTCLDFATTYATMCMASYVNVLLALIPGHAFVVLTPGRTDERPQELVEVPGFAAVEDGVLEGDVAALNEAASSLLVAVDATAVTRTEAGFETAKAFDPAQAGWEAPDQVLLVDVPMLQATGEVPPLARPLARTIRRYVPNAGVGFRAYEGDRELIERLEGDAGSTVLWGPPGQGKSMIARHLAEAEPAGAAWFLDASEPQALINSLASAVLGETGESAEKLEAAEREALAYSALARLREAEGTWLVVLDNADGDPAKLRKLLPTPGPGRRVLVTTTNRAWEPVPGFRFTPLPDVAGSDLDALGSPELARLADGRRLMLEAFRRLIEGSGSSGAAIAADAAGVDVEDEELRGPATFWEALRASPGFGERELRLSAFAAYLPPDHQPVALLAELAGEDASGPLGLLEERGLLAADAESESIRVHRLFGAAVRRQLDAERPELRDEAVYLLGTEDNARRVLDRYGDLATVSRLDQRLAAIDAETADPDERLGLALHGIAGLLERFGQTRLSGETYRRAQRHLDGHPAEIADCLMGQARTINQHHKREEGQLRQAVEWARSAREIQLRAETEGANADRCLAMEGLLTKALAQFPGPDETRVGVLHRALEILEAADEGRRDHPQVREDEKARSRFNLAGIRIDLAKAEPDRAEAHLDEAERIYGEVRDWRKRLYRCDVHPHIAACIAGLGYVGYYRATLIPASPRQRSAWLRESTDHTVEGLKQREILDGSIDLDEAPKSAAFLAKVALARHASPVAADTVPKRVFDEATRELKPQRIVLETIPPLAPNGRDVEQGIERWARSPALDELVRLSGGAVPSGLELDALLAWLEEFSGCWDFRAGRERNLFTSRSLDVVTDKAIGAAAAALGLVKGGVAPSGVYDHVLILGGLARACLARPLHAAKLLGDRKIEAGSVTALGGYRELKGDELGLVERITGERLGDDAAVADEFEAMDAGVRLAFGLDAPSEERGEHSDLEGGSWRVHEYRADGVLPVHVVAAPSGEPGARRTNTADSFEWFARELVGLQEGQRLLLVTSDIYVPFQNADALRVLGLPCGAAIETAGIQPGDVDPRLNQVFSADAYLQEVRSTIMAFRRLLAAVRGGAG